MFKPKNKVSQESKPIIDNQIQPQNAEHASVEEELRKEEQIKEELRFSDQLYIDIHQIAEDVHFLKNVVLVIVILFLFSVLSFILEAIY